MGRYADLDILSALNMREPRGFLLFRWTRMKMDWMSGMPRSQTYRSHFARLATA